MTSLTARISNLICGFPTGSLPEEAIHRGRIAVMDCVGVALAGSREPVGRIMGEYAAALPECGEATLWGSAKKVAASEAAASRKDRRFSRRRCGRSNAGSIRAASPISIARRRARAWR
jgi:hypothetical protein